MLPTLLLDGDGVAAGGGGVAAAGASSQPSASGAGGACAVTMDRPRTCRSHAAVTS